MTDKQIINGVNVNECDNHYIENNKHICKYNFKECRPKKEQCTLYVTSIEKQLKRKEQECEGLKRQHQADKGLIISTGKMNYQLIQEYDKLKNCLTEIKEIAKHCMKQDICTTCDYSEKCHIEDEEIPTYDVCKLILQKISECEVE